MLSLRTSGIIVKVSGRLLVDRQVSHFAPSDYPEISSTRKSLQNGSKKKALPKTPWQGFNEHRLSLHSTGVNEVILVPFTRRFAFRNNRIGL